MANRSKDWLLKGKCDLPNGEVIYFYGKTTAVSANQAHFNLCWDIKRCFNIDQKVNPEINECNTLSSKYFLARRCSPNHIKYFSDRERNNEIIVERKPSCCASSIYGEEGEELVDLSALGL